MQTFYQLFTKFNRQAHYVRKTALNAFHQTPVLYAVRARLIHGRARRNVRFDLRFGQRKKFDFRTHRAASQFPTPAAYGIEHANARLHLVRSPRKRGEHTFRIRFVFGLSQDLAV